MLEREWQKQVIDLAVAHGWKYFHTSPKQVRAGSWRSDGKGFPDLVLAHWKHGIIFAELKSDSGRLSDDQKDWAVTLVNHTTYRVWRPKDFEEVVEMLQGKK